MEESKHHVELLSCGQSQLILTQWFFFSPKLVSPVVHNILETAKNMIYANVSMIKLIHLFVSKLG